MIILSDFVVVLVWVFFLVFESHCCSKHKGKYDSLQLTVDLFLRIVESPVPSTQQISINSGCMNGGRGKKGRN